MGTEVEMPAGDRRFWPRPEKDRHILGEIRCVTVGETKVQALMLYESSFGRGCEPPEDVALRGKVIGSMDAIRCTICGKVHDWIIGQDAVNELLSKGNST
jgi:hypothetical protein